MVDWLETESAERLPEAEYERRRRRLQELIRMGADPATAIEVFESELERTN
jgi:hypothetical protein